MKKLEIVVRPEKLKDVLEALADLGVSGFTVVEARGAGKQGGVRFVYRGGVLVVRLIPKVKVEAVVPDDRVDRIIDRVVEVAKTGEPGDGKIFVVDVQEAVRIRTGERGLDAL